MAQYKRLLIVVFLLAIGLFIASADANNDQQTNRHKPNAHFCRLLESSFIDSQPWSEYPIIFQPIARGRLTIWSGISTLPSSELDCHFDANDTEAQTIRLNFVNFSEKLEWTFFDLKRGTTYNGVSVNQRENMELKVNVKPADSYLECNSIGAIELIQDNGDESSICLESICHECDHSILKVINNQIKQLIRTRLDQQIVDNLQWHLAELISSQHSTGPIYYERS